MARRAHREFRYGGHVAHTQFLQRQGIYDTGTREVGEEPEGLGHTLHLPLVGQGIAYAAHSLGVDKVNLTRALVSGAPRHLRLRSGVFGHANLRSLNERRSMLRGPG